VQVIREILDDKTFVVCVEHDLSVLDYLSDFICCLYGKPGAYGVVTMPFSVREGINIFLAGFVPTENMRFREEELTFKVSDQADDLRRKNEQSYTYPGMIKRQGNFELTVEAGNFNDSEILVMLGENGTGKTTFIRMLAGAKGMEPDEYVGERVEDMPTFNVSYKPQKISPKYESTVRNLLHSKIRNSVVHPTFTTDVMKPLRIEELMDQEVQNLSGGELQRVALVLCLGKPADLYLIDEPSAYLDSEQRIIASKVIKRYIMHSKKTAFIVEHDFIMSAYLADRVIVYSVRSLSLSASAHPSSTLVHSLCFRPPSVQPPSPSAHLPLSPVPVTSSFASPLPGTSSSARFAGSLLCFAPCSVCCVANIYGKPCSHGDMRNALLGCACEGCLRGEKRPSGQLNGGRAAMLKLPRSLHA
jgi:ATP-binding cassette, sub-family E, member 1